MSVGEAEVVVPTEKPGTDERGDRMDVDPSYPARRV
jgi:hypothetical protein